MLTKDEKKLAEFMISHSPVSEILWDQYRKAEIVRETEDNYEWLNFTYADKSKVKKIPDEFRKAEVIGAIFQGVSYGDKEMFVDCTVFERGGHILAIQIYTLNVVELRLDTLNYDEVEFY